VHKWEGFVDNRERLFVIVLNAYAGWLLTIALRYIYRKARTLSPLKILILVGASLYFIALIWTVNNWGIYKKGYRPEELYRYFKDSINSLIMIGCWMGGYFGIKNYQMLMKYFPFNTLRAISTLILMKENKTAETMVSHISG
jgi:two-component system LytT family sensor kinase